MNIHVISNEELLQGRRFCKWMVDEIIPSIGNRTLEIGAGVGTISRMLPKKEKLTVTDSDPEVVGMIKQIYADNELVDVDSLDITDASEAANFLVGILIQL